MKRLNTEKSLAPYVVQFVPLKVDTASAEYRALQSKHRSEGNSIPIIFLIRADGTKLYAKSGSLSGDQLPSLMTAAIREMGRPLALKEVKILDDINRKITEALDKDEFKTVAMLFGKLKRLGSFGQIGSYAKSAVENNALAMKYKGKVNKLTDEYSSALDSTDKLVNSIKAMMLKSDVGSLAPFKVSMNELEKKVRSSLESPQLHSEVKNVASAIRRLNLSSGKSQQRAVDTINRFAAKPEAENARKFLQDLVSAAGASANPSNSESSKAKASTKKKSTIKAGTMKTFRLWTSDDGQFSVKAAMVSFDGKNVRLERESGKVITVPLSKLSSADQEFARSRM